MSKGKAEVSSVFRFNKEQEKVEEICQTPAIKIEDSDKKSKESASSALFNKNKSCSVDDVSVSSSPSQQSESSSWKLFKERVQQAVEDIKTRKDTKDDDSELDDISESSSKTDMTNEEAGSDTSLLAKGFSSFRNKKRSYFSKLASKKESSSPSKTPVKKDEPPSDTKDDETESIDSNKDQSKSLDQDGDKKSRLDEEEKEKSDVESGVEVLEEMIFVHQTIVAGESPIIVMKTEPRRLSGPPTPTESNPSPQPNPLEQFQHTLKFLASQEAFMFAILACTVTLILRLSPFFQGAFLSIFFMLVYKNTCEWLKQSVINKTIRSKEKNNNFGRSISMDHQIGSIAEHKPIKSYQGWMNMIEKYKPEEYHVSETQSVMVKLEGTTLRLCFTRAKISKRHLWNESSKKRIVERFSDEKVYDIQGAKVELWPRGLARKRYFSRKYPIRICFSVFENEPISENGLESKDAPDQEENHLHRTDSQISVKSLEMDDTTSGSVSVDTLEYKDCEDDDKNILYLFARCDREKEDWLRRLRAAAVGDIYDRSRDSPVNTATQSSPIKPTSRNSTPDDSPSKTIGKQESEESNKDEEFDKLEDDLFTMFNQIISPCASRSASDFVQFITAYENKNLYDSNRKTPDNESFVLENGGTNLSKPLKPDVFWTNLVVGRILYGIIHDSSILDEIHTFLQKKLSAIKLPNFMEEVNIAEINLGNTPPLVHKIYPPALDERGIWIDADVTYEGLISATISTKLNLMRLKKQEGTNVTPTQINHSITCRYSKSAPVETICDSEAESTGESSSESDDDTSSITETENTTTTATATSSQTPAPANKKRLLRIVNTITTSNLFQSATEIPYIQRAMENMSKNLKLRVELKGLVARVVINLPSPPSDRCWLGFRYPPRIYMSAKPTVGEKLFDWTIVTNAIENKLCDEIYKYLVYPNLIDVIMPILGQPTYRE